MSLTIKLPFTSTAYLNFRFSTKPTSFTGYNAKIRPKPIYHFNPLTTTFSTHHNMQVPVQSSYVIKSSLIEPDGGVLVNLVVPESERAAKTVEAESLPKVRLTKIDVEWVHVISEGWASPLKGFMREDEYLQSLHFNSLRMKDGSIVNMSLPIVLAIDDETKDGIGTSPNVGLVGPDGDLIAILRRCLLLNLFLYGNVRLYLKMHVTTDTVLLATLLVSITIFPFYYPKFDFVNEVKM